MIQYQGLENNNTSNNMEGLCTNTAGTTAPMGLP